MTDAEIGSLCVKQWAPPIPTIGRGGQCTLVPIGHSFLEKLRSYFLEVECSPDFFVRAIPSRFRRRNRLFGASFPEKLFLRDLEPSMQFKFIMSRVWVTLSLNFQRRLGSMLLAGRLSEVRQWFYTANGVVFPYLIEGKDDYKVIDSLTKYALENCAQNYAQFTSSLKWAKKTLRKTAATLGLHSGVLPLKLDFNGKTRQHWPYISTFFNVLKSLSGSKRDRFSSLLLWTQSRATGLCNAQMMASSFEKFVSTTSESCQPLEVDISVLQSCIRCDNVTGLEAQVSCGPKACLQSPQKPEVLPDSYYQAGTRPYEVGGQTRYLLYLSRTRVLDGEYDFKTLEFKRFDRPRPVRGPLDLLNWAVHSALTNGLSVRTVRYHCVADQSKARSITVAHYAYQVIMGVFAHALVPAVYSPETRSGLKADRHLWNFVHTDLSPDAMGWDGFPPGGETAAFSTDLSEATDFGNWWFAKAVWSEFIRQTRGPRQPTALMLLAKTLYTSPRPVFHRVGGTKYTWFLTQRAFLMGDLFTKVVLTVGQDYNARVALAASPLGRAPGNDRIPRLGTVKPYNLDTLSKSGHIDRPAFRFAIAGASYSLVGDDIVLIYSALLMNRYSGHCSPDSVRPEYADRLHTMEPWFRQSAESAGWKISLDDTFDSPHLMFYAEEGSLVPSSAQESTRHSIWTGRHVGYLDYPRIRLLLPVKMETDNYSQTNVGRFALLGKEAKWVVDTSTARTMEKYSVAQILQHLVVPRDIETLCPFTPQEIGGDGAYCADAEYLLSIIFAKSRDPAETLFRMKQQLTNLWGHRFVSTEKHRAGLQKQHLILPTTDRMKSALPVRSIIVPPTEEHRILLDSVPRGILESPQTTFFKVVKRLYYSSLFKGRLLPSLRVAADVGSKRGATPLSVLTEFFEVGRMEEYILQWRRPGFRYYDVEPYFVVPYRHKDIMSIGWNWKFRPERAHELARVGVDEFLDVIMRGKTIPLIEDRLNLFFETDPLLIIRVRDDPSYRGAILLVSWDKKLAHRIVSFIRNNRDPNSVVYLVHPSIFQLGRIDELGLQGKYLEDKGSINYINRTAASSNLHEAVCFPLRRRWEPAYPGVLSVSIQGYRNWSKRTRFSLRGPSEGLQTDISVWNSGAPEFDRESFLSEYPDTPSLSLINQS